MNNIVVFGMAHSGKSTCIGYMLCKTKEKNEGFDFERYVEKLRIDTPEYDDSRDYGYLVDEFLEERIRTRSHTGTSKQMHLKTVEINGVNVKIIDTPGGEHRAKERQRGMYYGDIGIFCIEIRQLTSEDLFMKKDLLTTFMTTMVLWEKFNRRTIVALTKMDECDFDEQTYLKGREIIKQLCERINISAIIPISINVRGRTSHNIYSKSEDMAWYKGETLESAISREVEQKNIEPDTTPLLFYIDKSYKKTRLHTGQSWRIKILQGNIYLNQEIYLSPVRVNNEIGTVKAKIKSIRGDLEKEKIINNMEMALPGSFVGIDLTDIRMGNRNVRKGDLTTLKTSCGFSANLQCKTSDIFTFRTRFMNLDKCNINRQMNMLWFGRPITFQVIQRESTTFGIEVTAKGMGWSVTMPFDKENGFLIKDLIIQYDTNPSMDPFIEAELIDIIDEYSKIK